MRFMPVVALLLAVSALAAGRSRAATTPPSTAAPTAVTPPVSMTPVSTAGPSSADNEAAARHAKRTACINQARTKKLVGAKKTAYIKGCIGAP